jgi:NAD(P)-dependent dehydrogenase (short-subunit alcohol dehydrogenase family)
MKTIFITGASSGIGMASAKLFANNGWKVIATMRNPQKDSALRAIENIEVLELDVTSLGQIRSVVKNVLRDNDMDVVFNNAGYSAVGPLEGMSDTQIIRQLDTLLLGVIRVTKEFIPYFREKRKGLFITTTSIGGLMSFPLSSLYHAAKWGLEGWSESMSFELNKLGIGIKTVSPGTTLSNFFDNMEIVQHEAYNDLLGNFQRMMKNATDTDDISSPEQMAEVVYEAATDGKNKLRYLGGENAKAIYARRLEVGDEVFRKEMYQTIFG